MGELREYGQPTDTVAWGDVVDMECDGAEDSSRASMSRLDGTASYAERDGEKRLAAALPETEGV